jgi:hypothetical protein
MGRLLKLIVLVRMLPPQARCMPGAHEGIPLTRLVSFVSGGWYSFHLGLAAWPESIENVGDICIADAGANIPRNIGPRLLDKAGNQPEFLHRCSEVPARIVVYRNIAHGVGAPGLDWCSIGHGCRKQERERV